MFQTEWAPQWDALMTPETCAVLDKIEAAVGEDFYPAKENVLRFLRMDTPVRYCIVGMDPYPSWNERDKMPQATGRAFEVSELTGRGWDVKIKQASLRNMIKAIRFNQTGEKISMEQLRGEIADGSFQILPPTPWFDAMEAQGVLFLNSTLTVRPGKAGSHQKLWEPFRRILIPFLDRQGVAWMLWGSSAQKEIGAYLGPASKVLTASHPRMPDFVEHNTFRDAPEINWTGCD
ncbi:MAG: uracil-DNA glycosylase [Oscillospiraceae bacterium]|nr:uracil-DNA glycosylase [Oscillospiraceae bacterium]